MPDLLVEAQRTRLVRYDATGNVYAIVPEACSAARSPAAWAAVACGDGTTDGVLLAIAAPPGAPYGVRVVNPDGSLAEVSGNGLRIFARWLFDTGRVHAGVPFRVDTGARTVVCTVLEGGERVSVAMGTIDVTGPRTLRVGNGEVRATIVNVGNPHAVVLREGPMDETAFRALGASLERHPAFPQRTNVQTAWPDPDEAGVLHARIWERGVGWTASSGSSACAVAAAFRATAVPADDARSTTSFLVRMPGGDVTVQLVGRTAWLEGPVEPLAFR